MACWGINIAFKALRARKWIRSIYLFIYFWEYKACSILLKSVMIDLEDDKKLS
jgi:hypothetical protein